MKVRATLVKIILVALTAAFVTACGPSDNADGLNSNNTNTDTTPTLYSYKDYGHSYAVKTFSLTGTTDDTLTHTFTRSPGVVSYNRIESYLGTVNRDRDFYLDTTGTTLDLYQRVHKNVLNPSIIENDFTFSPGVVFAATDMVIGTPRSTNVSIYQNGSFAESFISTITLLAIESVTVPYGTFNACLKIRRVDGVNTKFGGERTVTSWRCAGYGTVKVTFEKLNQPTVTRQLTAVTM